MLLGWTTVINAPIGWTVIFIGPPNATVFVDKSLWNHHSAMHRKLWIQITQRSQSASSSPAPNQILPSMKCRSSFIASSRQKSKSGTLVKKHTHTHNPTLLHLKYQSIIMKDWKWVSKKLSLQKHRMCGLQMARPFWEVLVKLPQLQ